METYNYDDSAAMPGYDTETSATPSVPETGNSNDVPAAPGFGPEGPVTPSVPTNPADSNVPATPGFGPSGSVTPTVPSSGMNVPATPGFGPLGPVTPSLPSSNSNMGCVNCTGNIIWPNSSTGILWTWGTLSPFFSTTSDIAHVRFYNAAAIREPLDIYLNGRLVVSNLDYMNYTRYLHIIPGVYRLTVFRRTNPGVPIIDTGVQFRGGNSYTLTILGTANSYSVQVMTS
ncbi:hypothetical protein CLOSYM_04816 [[Clostridium] symbiosum ATCC 14940]|uniref:DUF4397 domain-containing protein n=1 Tax=[Clostridium] symbiosum ATCC 14940 TaxID=411472 RepID=A0ABC9TR23_CLOSY|nr:DUF4397 domain-containing protein [[Clostridium] symbiosum]ERI73526.1 hypothetical protein CLOSYM_04816 [[Clostridium] symbiosum ATCC 14940]